MEDKYFKGYLTNFNPDNINAIPIIFKVICINSMYFAQEICTQKIFPLFNYSILYDDENYHINSRDNTIVALSLVVSPDISQSVNYKMEGKPLVEFIISSDNNWPDFEKRAKEFTHSHLGEFTFTEKMSWNNKYVEEIEKKYVKNTNIFKLLNDKIQIMFDNDIHHRLINIDGISDDMLDTQKISDLGYDLSFQDNLCNLIGREEEIKKIIKAICIRKTSILLVGEAGCGKTSIIEKMALDIKNGNNKWLKGKTIFYVNAAALESGTKYRGDFEEKILRLINFSKQNNDKLILFIDEIHSLYGLGKSQESSTDAMNILKPYISNGDITIIGATTKEEYEKYMTTDRAFLRRFEKIDISLPDNKMMLDILLSYINELEKKHNIKLDLDSDKITQLINKIIELTDSKHQRIIGDVSITNPTLSKYILSDSFAEAVYNEKNIVIIEDICEAIKVCSKITPSTRNKIAEEIKEEFKSNSYVDEDKPNLIEFNPQKKLSTIS